MLTNIWDRKRGALNPSFLANILRCSEISLFQKVAHLKHQLILACSRIDIT